MQDHRPQSTETARLARIDRQQQALFDIGHLWRHYTGDPEDVIRKITETAAQALDIERVSVWQYTAARHHLSCIDLYEATPQRHSHGGELSAEQYPAYFSALEKLNVIAAEQATHDKHTRELADTYLKPLDIDAMLDVPIHAGSGLAGVLCHEHVGGRRRFYADEINTATHLASMLGATFELQLRLEKNHRIEELLRDEVALWNILFEQSRDAIVVLDEEGGVYKANKRYADMLGYSLEEFHRLHVWDWDIQFERAQILDMLQTVDDSGAHIETRQRCKNGEIVDVELSNNGAFYKGRKLIFCLARDITARKQDEEQIRKLATTDTLTGIANRREFTHRLQNEIERSKRYGTTLALVMYDFDHFKQVNDRFGHTAGDQVLTTVARLVNSNIRSVDVNGRWGGEEFMLLLPESDRAAAGKIAEKLRCAIAEYRFDELEPVTASFGVAEFCPQDSIDSLLKRVDDALYQAKESGRNRVATADCR